MAEEQTDADDSDSFTTLAAQTAAFDALGFDVSGMTPSCSTCGVSVTADQMQLHHDWHASIALPPAVTGAIGAA